MTPADAQQQRLLERLRDAGDQPVAFAEQHASGIAFPAAVVSELELNGYAIERVDDHGRMVGVRLLQPEPPDAATGPRWRRPHRQPAAVHFAITADDRGCEVWCVLRPLDAAKAHGFTVIVRAVQSSGNGRSCRSASVDWIVSAARRADDLRQARVQLARARAVPLTAQAVRSRTQWQSSGEPSSDGSPTPRGSCATTEIGVRLDARPRSLSAALENECGNPTHDRVAAFRQIHPRRAIAQNLLVVRLLTYAWRGSLRPCSSALARVRSARRDVQPSSGIDRRRKASAVSRRPG